MMEEHDWWVTGTWTGWLLAIMLVCAMAFGPGPVEAQAPTCSVPGCTLQYTQLDPDNRYMVLVRGQIPAYWRDRLEIEEQIRDCFQSAGFERDEVGVLFLDGFEIEIILVTDESS